jgi:hypothetical protein
LSLAGEVEEAYQKYSLLTGSASEFVATVETGAKYAINL